MEAVTALRIYNGGNTGCIPMADILHVDGAIDKAVRWDVIDNRKNYNPFITAYTHIYDDRPKPDIRKWFDEFDSSRMKLVRSHINMDGIHSEKDYYIDKMNMYIKHGYAYFHTYTTDYNYVGVYPAYCFEDLEENEDEE